MKDDVTVPPCRCGLVMRTCHERDAWECRCGMSLDAQPVYAAHHAGAPVPDAAWHQGEPWKEPPAGIRVSNDFADIGPLFWGYAILDDGHVDPAALQRACADAFECSGLRYLGSTPPARVLEVDGETLRRQRVYAVAPLGQEAAAIRGVVEAIRVLHGPGKVWAHGSAPVTPLKHYGERTGYRGGVLGGVMHAVLACYYFHKPDAAP